MKMLSLEHLQLNALFIVLVVTALALVGLRVTVALARRHVVREGERVLREVTLEAKGNGA